MQENEKLVRIHMCDDDPDDQLLVSDALEEARLSNPIDFTSNGKELLQYLKREGDYADLIDQSLPGLILLDLNMPVMDGREVLKQLKHHEKFGSIPVIVLTTSKAEEDIARSYNMGVNSFIIKPVAFESLVEMVATVTNYWFNLVSLPPEE